VVEDEPDLREAVAEYLGASGYEVATAENAAAARTLLQLIDGERPDTHRLELATTLIDRQSTAPAPG